MDQAGGGWAELFVVQQALMADVAQAAIAAVAT
jgi:hypothetical protein